MGMDGEDLLELLDVVEKKRKHKLTRQLLSKVAKEYSKAYEYDLPTKAALMNWTSGVAQGLVKHGTEGGQDAWRKLCHKYMPLADDQQNIFIRQLMSIRFVNEGDMDSLFDEMERIRELYVKAGSNEEPMSERWLRTAIFQNLPEQVVQKLAIELKKATFVEDMYSMINTYTFDHRTGLHRGQTNPMLYLAEGLAPEKSMRLLI